MTIKRVFMAGLLLIPVAACGRSEPAATSTPTVAQPQPATPLPQPTSAPPQPTATLPQPATVPPTSAPTSQPTTADATPAGFALGSINGWVWHDLCAVSGEGGPVRPGAGCVQDTRSGYRANGQMEPGEPPIGGVQVRLSAGACPSAAFIAETTTIITDLSYSFTGLNAGTYCVSIDPLQASNASILLPGGWTYPFAADGPISATVTLKAGENKFNVNFGWDYQFLPPVDQACVYRIKFLGDVTIPDNTIVSPGAPFVKTWRLRNDGNCTWGPYLSLHSLWFVNGAQMSAPNEVPLPRDVPPGETVDVSIHFIAPMQSGLYRSEWMLLKADGPLLGVGPDGQTPLYVQIVAGHGDGSCIYKATFLGDVTIPDNTVVAPGAPFLKTWRVRNDGTCTWGAGGYALHALKFVGGDRLGNADVVELSTVVRPGQTTDLSIYFIAPLNPGVYRSEWKLMVDNGPLVGVGRDGTLPVYTQIIVGSNPPPGAGSISGIVWDDQCQLLPNGSYTGGCVLDNYGAHANGVRDFGEALLVGVRVTLGVGNCPSAGLAQTFTGAGDVSYRFDNLPAGTYCVTIDPLDDANRLNLLPGQWTFPGPLSGAMSLAVDFISGVQVPNVNFGWDFQLR